MITYVLENFIDIDIETIAGIMLGFYIVLSMYEFAKNLKIRE